MGNSIPTIGANNQQEPNVDGQYSLFQDQRQQTASAQTNLGFNTVSQNATNVPRAGATPKNERTSQATSGVERTVKNIATDVQKLEGLSDVEATLEKMDEKLGKLVKAEESEEKARKAKKRQEELPKNQSADEIKDAFKGLEKKNRAGQVAGAGLSAVAGAGIMALLFGPKILEDMRKSISGSVEEMKEKASNTLDRLNKVQQEIKKNVDDYLGTGNRIQEATDEEQIAAKLALQSGLAGKTLTTGVDALTSKPVAQAAVGATGLAAKGTGWLAGKTAQVSASVIDSATTAMSQAGQTISKTPEGRTVARNNKTGQFAKPGKGTELRKGLDASTDWLANKANAAKNIVANSPKATALAGGIGKGLKGTANLSALIAKEIARSGGRLVAKVLPGVGAAIGGGMSINKMIEGDYYGAAAAGAGAVLSFVPGVGTAGAVGIGAYEMAREIYNNAYEQYPEKDPDSAERWPIVLDETKDAVVKYVDDFFNKDKRLIAKAEESGLYKQRNWDPRNSKIDLDMAQSATTGELEAILRDDDLADDDKASVQAILKKRAEAIDQGTPLSVAPGEAASLEADQAAESVLASNTPKIDATRRQPATDDLGDLAMAGATGQQPIVNVAPTKVDVPKIDAPSVNVVVYNHDPFLNPDPFARGLGYA